jgi:hypothetical protein
MADPKPFEYKSISKLLKSQHQNQLIKLTLKAESELEFLDSLRDYLKKRSELEIQYAKVSLI